MNEAYNKIIMEHFRNPKNMGEIKNPDSTAEMGNPVCGDVIKIYIKIKDNKISDCKFETMGCATAIATASIITQLAIGKSLEKAKNITDNDISIALGGLPKVKFHCSNLAAKALKKAIEKYEQK